MNPSGRDGEVGRVWTVPRSWESVEIRSVLIFLRLEFERQSISVDCRETVAAEAP